MIVNLTNYNAYRYQIHKIISITQSVLKKYIYFGSRWYRICIQALPSYIQGCRVKEKAMKIHSSRNVTKKIN